MREALIATAGMCLFALFALRPLPLFVVALAGLLIVAALLARALEREPSPGATLGWTPLSRRVRLWTAAGGLFGLLLATAYRQAYGLTLFPASLARFAVPAALIGAMEEFVFRGDIQGRVSSAGLLVAPAFAALGHTAYKCALFLFPPAGVEIQLPLLALLTFVAGFVLGLLRQISGSVLPAVAAHVLFDVLAYGDRSAAPWWVWS